jgi:outer membrane protein insertion porin family
MHLGAMMIVLLPGILYPAAEIPAAVPSTITSITIYGNDRIGSSEILGWLSSRPSQVLASEVLRRDAQSIVEEYRKEGYLAARVDSVTRRYTFDSSSVEIGVYVAEGRRSVIGSIVLEGVTVFSSNELVGLFTLGPGDPLNEFLLEADIDAVLDRYDRAGYALSSCSVKDLRTVTGDEDDSIDVTLAVQEGPLVRINEIRVRGNQETNSDVIVRETRVSPGERFDPAKVGAIERRLQRLNIFSSVSQPELFMHDSSGGLLISVQEGRSNTFDGVIGYVPEPTGGGGYVTGLISVGMRNLFGTGRKFQVRWQREDRFSQELAIRYTEPWLFGVPLNLGGGFFQRQQDTSFVKRAIDMRAELMVTEEFSVSVVGTSENVIPSASAVSSSVFRTSTTTLGAELVYDTRDDFYSPTSGARYRTDYQYGKRRTDDIPPAYAGVVKEKVDVQKLTFDMDAYTSTFSRQVLALGVHGRQLTADQIDEAQMYRFGGTNTLRGYRENQFLGSLLAWTNTEYRFLLQRRTFLYGFIDTGYYFRPEDTVRGTPSSESFQTGYGIGVQIETGLGNIGVSYALGEGDTFSTGKVHFGLINEF